MKAIENKFGKFVDGNGTRFNLRNTSPKIDKPEEGIEIPDDIQEVIDQQKKDRQAAFRVEFTAAGYTRSPLTDVEVARMVRKVEIATERWKTEMGGFRLPAENGGMFIHTDARTRTLLVGAAVNANADPEYTVPHWKTKEGSFVVLDAATILLIYGAVNQFIAAQWAQEAALTVELDAAETEKEINAITWG